MFRLVLIALASFSLTGCFVFEEIRKGNELMDQHASTASRQKKTERASLAEAAEGKAPKGKASKIASLVEWKNKTQEELSEWWDEVAAEGPIAPPPDDPVIRCQANGQVRFTRKSQCENQRGRTIAVYSKDEGGG